VNAAFIAKALGGKKCGTGWIAQCVAHDDTNPSMSIADGEKGGVVVKCHAGCDQRELMHVLMARGLWADRKNGREIIRTHDYTDENGKLAYQVVRFPPKEFRQRRPDDDGGWTWLDLELKGVKPVLYRLPEVLEGIKGGKQIFIVEGEKDADTMVSHGYVATCNSGGAGKWTEAHSKWLKGADVIVIPDNDEPGRKHAKMVKMSLAGIATTVKFVTIDSAKDVSDWFASGHTTDQFDALLAAPSAELNESKARDVVVQRLSDIAAKPITWGRIARGKPSVIAGHPGLGKSQIAASLAAIATTGGLWPVDRSTSPIGSVVVLSAEDDAADTIRPRLEAAGADVTKVHILHAVIDNTPNGEEVQRAFNLRADIRRLEQVIADIGDVVLVVIDPVSAYVGTADSHNNAEIRGLLAPLSEMAARQNVAVVMVSHLNKGGAGSEALLRVTGSLAFVAAARAAFIVAKTPKMTAARCSCLRRTTSQRTSAGSPSGSRRAPLGTGSKPRG
jgi:putative DNA primase/helicase